MVDTLTLNNDGVAAWEVTTFSGSGITTQIGVDNPDIELTVIGTRYEITNDGYPTHPLEFLDDQDNVLLSQSTTGSFESDSGVNWVDNDTSVEFTLTQALSNELTTYRCTVHTGAMVGNIISPEIDYTPNTGSVSITSPAEGDVVTPPFDVVMSATDFTIEAASNDASDGAGHFHILVDQDAIAAGEAIPNDPDNGYYHYGDGSTTATLDLDPGAHTIRIQAGTANHLAYDLTDSVDIIVESDIQSTPIINAIDNVNQTSLETVFAAVAADPTARDNLSQSDRNIDAVSTNVGLIEELNASEEAIRKMLCRREGRDPANFVDLDAVAADQGLMQAIIARQESLKILTRSQKASAAAASSQTAMQEVIASQTGRDEVFASQTAMQEVAGSQTAMQEVASSQTAMQDVAASQTAMQEVASSQTAMTEIDQVDFAVRAIMCGTTSLDPTSFADADAISQDAAAMSEIAGSATTMNTIVASQTARDEVFASQTARNEVFDSQTAMQEVAGSQAAMQEVAASQSLLNDIGNNATVQNTVYNNNTAISALQSSNLVENTSATIVRTDDITLKDDRVILLTHDDGFNGERTNQPQFGANDNSFPHTADRIRRTNNRNYSSNTTTSASFIDIANS